MLGDENMFLFGLTAEEASHMSRGYDPYLLYTRDPVLRRVGTAFLRLAGSQADVSVEWSNINLQDETEYAQARLWNAQAAQIEAELEP